MDSLRRSKHEQIHTQGTDSPSGVEKLSLHPSPQPLNPYPDSNTPNLLLILCYSIGLETREIPGSRTAYLILRAHGQMKIQTLYYKIIKNFVNVDLPQPPHWPSSLQPLFNSIVLALIYVISLIPTTLTQYHLPGLLAPWTPCP